MHYTHTDGRDAAFVLLCAQLDDTLNALAGGVENRMEYVPLNALTDIHDAIVAYDGDLPVGCGSFKRFDESAVEFKRIFVKPEYRGKGVAKEILRLLEEKAREKGYVRAVLETGSVLTAANRLYRSVGFCVIPNYGEYANMPESVCMEKRL